MANIPFPSDLTIEAYELGLDWPGQITQIAVGGQTTVIPRGIGRFVGSLTFATMRVADEQGRANVGALQAFLNETEGRNSTFDIPVNQWRSRGFLRPGSIMTVVSSSVSGRNTSIVFTVVDSGGNALTIPNGHFRAGDFMNVVLTGGRTRLLQLAADSVGNQITVSPPIRSIPAGSFIRTREEDALTGNDVYTPTVTARRTETGPLRVTVRAGFTSPTLMQWEEVI